MMSSEGAPRANEIVLATSAKTTSSPDGMSRGGGGARASPAPLPASRRGAPGRAPKDGSGAPAGVPPPGRRGGRRRTGAAGQEVRQTAAHQRWAPTKSRRRTPRQRG